MTDSPPLIFRRIGDDLRPVNEAALEAVRGVRPNDICRAKELSRPRNLAKLQKYWALVHVTYAAQAGPDAVYPTPNALHEALKVALGVYETVRLMGSGKLVVVPGSIAFGNMAEQVFDRFFEDAKTLVRTHVLPGVSDDHLMHEIENLIGERRSWAA